MNEDDSKAITATVTKIPAAWAKVCAQTASVGTNTFNSAPSHEANVTMRELDRALWDSSKEKQ